MIQIDDWMVIVGILAIFLLSIVYLAIFIITRKLFSEAIEFQNEIKPNENIIISKIEGSGIIKKIEMKTTENDKLMVDIIIDQTSYVIFNFNKKTNSNGGNLAETEEFLSFEINLNKKFTNNFTIFFHNRNDKLAHSTGNIYYEIKKPLKTTLKAIISELH
jgi:hypothetical protein